MRTKVLFIYFLSVVSVYGIEVADSVWLPEVEVSVSRLQEDIRTMPVSVSCWESGLIEKAGVSQPKDLSALVPNVYMPDYGSAMTSSIYIRGMGSRINEPVMGLLLDGVPLMDKNMYDQALQDIKRVELLRGPLGSMYGRHSSAGVMEIRTIQPLDVTKRLIRGQVSYGSAHTVRAQASYYEKSAKKIGWGIAARYNRTDGFYRNSYNGSHMDAGQSAGGRIVLDGCIGEEWRLTGSVYADWVKQRAFPYAAVETGKIAYNREGFYERLAVMPTLRAEYRHEGYKLQMSASYQYLHDDMKMDNDYTVADIFVLRQIQHQHSGTLDAFLTAPKPCPWYDWTAGMSLFAKVNRMEAPVTFMREGIEELILGNANRGIQKAFPEDSLEIANTILSVPGLFDLYNIGAAAYHQSHFQFDNWHIRAGVRIDYEYTRMDYISEAEVAYRFTLMMPREKALKTHIEGTKQAHYLQVLPRLAVSYETSWGTVYACAAKGYKAGGYNPQMFSTITQNQLMTDMAADMGINLTMADSRFSDIGICSYKPETNWTFEFGTHLKPIEALRIDLDAFHIQCYDQQVTIFPTGKTSGRMMANAGRSRMWGLEAALHYRWQENKWTGFVDVSYGWTDARFVKFNDGMGEYAGKFIPYTPQHTVHGWVGVEYRINRKWLQGIEVSVKGDGLGRIYWNEQNDRWQAFYGLLGATICLKWQYVELELWGKNLTGTHYDVFYFRSMDNDFLQHGKPKEMGVRVRLEI